MNKGIVKVLLSLCLAVFSATLLANGATEDINVSDLYVLTSSEGQRNSTVYMQLENDCRCEDHALVAAHSPVANTVELHTQINESGISEMQRLDEIQLTANSTVVLKPGGMHVMLIGLKRQIKDGDSIPLVLEFEDGSRLEVSAPAKTILAKNSQ